MTYSSARNATSSGKEPGGLFSFLKGARKAASSRSGEGTGIKTVTAQQASDSELDIEVNLVLSGLQYIAPARGLLGLRPFTCLSK